MSSVAQVQQEMLPINGILTEFPFTLWSQGAASPSGLSPGTWPQLPFPGALKLSLM